MGERLQNFIDRIQNRYSPKQALFVAAAVVMFIILVWFSISNFVFLVKNLNDAFVSEPEAQQQHVEFNREAFNELNIIQ